jgi:TetR/AcrR family transcriptional regulator, transcriptional repressor for nem operon
MRYEKSHKETTRRRVVETASARFRKEGLDGVGIASLMNDAGLTHGGFYSHFASKEALIAEAVASSMEGTFANLSRAAENGGIEEVIRVYLRPRHRDHPEKGCAAAALAAEIARQSKPTRTAFTKKTNALISFIEKQLPNPDAATARAIFATLMGALQLSRAMSDRALSDKMLEAGETAALALVRRNREGR